MLRWPLLSIPNPVVLTSYQIWPLSSWIISLNVCWNKEVSGDAIVDPLWHGIPLFLFLYLTRIWIKLVWCQRWVIILSSPTSPHLFSFSLLQVLTTSWRQMLSSPTSPHFLKFSLRNFICTHNFFHPQMYTDDFHIYASFNIWNIKLNFSLLSYGRKQWTISKS